MNWLSVMTLIVLLTVVVFVGSMWFPASRLPEGFTTVALNTTTFPSCVQRDAEAQALLTSLYGGLAGFPPASDAAMAYDEFKLIVQKLLCADADITSFGAGEYASLRLPFNTQHDMEPIGTFVGRCLRNAVKERDLSITFDKFRQRGVVLLGVLCPSSQSKAVAMKQFDSIVDRMKQSISKVCLKEHASMDVPAGVRDPGYYTPSSLTGLGPYQNTAPQYNFN